ncbi:hypothetical protein CF069_12295 [Clostridium botulinum]
MLTLKKLEKFFCKARENNIKYIGIIIKMSGFNKPEIIINPNVNLNSKFNYYKKTYDENLNHKFAKDIKIVGVSIGNSFQEIYDNLKEWEGMI